MISAKKRTVFSRRCQPDAHPYVHVAFNFNHIGDSQMSGTETCGCGKEASMIAIVGVFKSRSDAELSSEELRSAGITGKNINILTPEVGNKEIARVPMVGGEQPGMVKAIGAVAGGAAGVGVGEAVAALLVPGVGAVLAVGMAGGALLGALAGGTLGGVAERGLFSGLPADELFVYQDALRQGRTVLIAMAADSKQAEAGRAILDRAGAESVDRAREMWWIGLRNVEKEHYEAGGGDFRRDEPSFRCGFAAALEQDNRDKSYEQCREQLKARYPAFWNSSAFQAGYERGAKYARARGREH
jgi:hypothetical protein